MYTKKHMYTYMYAYEYIFSALSPIPLSLGVPLSRCAKIPALGEGKSNVIYMAHICRLKYIYIHTYIHTHKYVYTFMPLSLTDAFSAQALSFCQNVGATRGRVARALHG